MFGVDPKEIAWTVAAIKWMIAALQQLATKAGVELPTPPEQPE